MNNDPAWDKIALMFKQPLDDSFGLRQDVFYDGEGSNGITVPTAMGVEEEAVLLID